MAPSTRSNFTNIRKVGSFEYRPLRFISFCHNQSLRLQRLKRSTSTLHRRIQSFLELQARMAVSSTQPHPTSVSSPEQKQRTFSIYGSNVEENILASGFGQQKHRTPNAHSTPRQSIDRSCDQPTTSRGGRGRM